MKLERVICIYELSTHDYALCLSNHIQRASQVAVNDRQ